MKGKLVLSSIEFIDIFCNDDIIVQENDSYKVKFPTKENKKVVFIRNEKEIILKRRIRHHILGTLFSTRFNAISINPRMSRKIFDEKNFPLDESEYIVWITKNKSKHLNMQCKMGDYHIKKIRFRIR